MPADHNSAGPIDEDEAATRPEHFGIQDHPIRGPGSAACVQRDDPLQSQLLEPLDKRTLCPRHEEVGESRWTAKGNARGREQRDDGIFWPDRKVEAARSAPPLKVQEQTPTIGLHGAADPGSSESRLRLPDQRMQAQRVHDTQLY
jgi:hypothetical protein